jgi:hypothetical protein
LAKEKTHEFLWGASGIVGLTAQRLLACTFFFNRLAIHDLCDLCNLVLFCAFEIPSARFFDLVWPKMKRDRFASAQTNAIGEMG